jgi:hypothetical protein
MDNNFFQRLQRDAYESLDISNYCLDIQGWIMPNFDTTFEEIIRRFPKGELIILEVGSWKGLSAKQMIDLIKKNEYSVKMICIDTWLGAPEFWTYGFEDTKRGVALNKINGYPNIFYTFTKNMKMLNYTESVVPLPISSVQGAEVLKYYKIKANIIYIDAAHEYESVLSDLESYYPLLAENGVMFGDDYTNYWPGVIKATNEFVLKYGKTLTQSNGLWVIY